MDCDEMMPHASFLGGGIKFQTGSNVVLKRGSKRVQAIDPTASIDVTLPDATVLKEGGPIFIIFNTSGSYTLTVKDNDGDTIDTLTSGQSGILVLLDNSTSAGVWAMNKYPKFSPW